MRRTRGHRSVVAWIAVLGMSLAVFGLSAGASAQGAADDPGQVEAGKTVYEMACAGCHGADGMGSERGRPLTGIAAQQPDRSVHIMSVTDGKGNMPAFAERLDAEQIDAAISYVRLTFVEEAAASGGDAELALTGTETPLLAVVGLTLILSGALVTRFVTRFDRD